MECVSCGKRFLTQDHNDAQTLRYIKERYPKNWQEKLEKYCPVCLKEIPKNDLAKYFWIIVISSTCILGYSLAFKFLKLNLPSFPFYYYIIAFGAIIYYLRSRHIKFLDWVLIFLNFLSPAFRNIFFSCFDNFFFLLVYLVLFVLSSFSVLNLISYFLDSFFLPQQSQHRAKWQFVSLSLYFLIYFGLVSPFHLGVINPKPLVMVESTVESYSLDKLYTETNLQVDEEADRKIAYQYFKEGKECAAKGNRTGFMESLQFYQKATELIPNFSSAYAEMAYSYASLSRIMKENGIEKAIREENFDKAKKAIEHAKNIDGSDNPIIWSIDAILEVYKGNQKKALEKLKKAENLTKGKGVTDRFLQAKVILTNDQDRKISFLLTANKIDHNNAELHNLLGVKYYLINNKKVAKELFKRAITLSPDYGEPYLNLALFSSSKDRIRLWKEAVAKDDSLKFVAANYMTLSRIQVWLRILYLSLIVFIFIVAIVFEIRHPSDKRKLLQYKTREDRIIEGITLFSLLFIFGSYLLYYVLYYAIFVCKNTHFLPIFCIFLWMISMFCIISIAKNRWFVYYLNLFIVTCTVFIIYGTFKPFYPIAINTMGHRFLSLFPFF